MNSILRDMEFELLSEKFTEDFLEITRDPMSKRFISGFEAEEQEIIASVSGLNDYPENGLTYAILEGGVFIGFIAQKKSADLYGKLMCGMSEWEEIPREVRRREAPLTVDIAIHPGHRGKGKAQTALKAFLKKINDKKLSEVVHFEVSSENTGSLKLMDSIGAEYVLSWILYDAEEIKVFEYRF
jgi:RimJ/RimL family protein N-acetyltransferase